MRLVVLWDGSEFLGCFQAVHQNLEKMRIDSAIKREVLFAMEDYISKASGIWTFFKALEIDIKTKYKSQKIM